MVVENVVFRLSISQFVPEICADNVFAPGGFKGSDDEDAETWLNRFNKYAVYWVLDDDERLRMMGVLLRDIASDWLDGLPLASKANWASFEQAFKSRFADSEFLRWRCTTELYNRTQLPSENVHTYIAAVRKLAKALGIDQSQEKIAIERGLRSTILQHVVLQQPRAIDELIQAARIAEVAQMVSSPPTELADVKLEKVVNERAASRIASEKNSDELRKLTTQLTTQHRSVRNIYTSRRSPTLDTPPRSPSSSKRVTFASRDQVHVACKVASKVEDA